MKLHPSRLVHLGVLALTTGLLLLLATVPSVAQTRAGTLTRVGSSLSQASTEGTWIVTGSSSRRSSHGSTAPSYPVEKGLTANAIAVHRAALVAWPEIKTYYGYRNDPSSDHYHGKALDLMVPGYTTAAGKTLGGEIAAWAVDNQPNLHIQYVIWNQHIWNVSRASEGWRLMADRGSDSANHKNHVHISVM